MNHLLTVISTTPCAEHLVLRGSVTMPAWVGSAARAPGDLDFVVTPHTITSGSADARALLQDIVAACPCHPRCGPAAGADGRAAIWTYERADGRRLVVPFSTADGPDGSVQIDIVFGERLPVAPDTAELPGLDVPLLAATAALSLAWKLLWLATDMYPQGKDLYDAALLAEHTTVDRELVRDLIRPELGAEADTFTARAVLSWEVDWANFTDEYPSVTGDGEVWKRTAGPGPAPPLVPPGA